jgi:hypothetical protein
MACKPWLLSLIINHHGDKLITSTAMMQSVLPSAIVLYMHFTHHMPDAPVKNPTSDGCEYHGGKVKWCSLSIPESVKYYISSHLMQSEEFNNPAILS